MEETITLYENPPLDGSVMLQELQKWSNERLELYKVLTAHTSLPTFSDLWIDSVLKDINTSVKLNTYKTILQYKNRPTEETSFKEAIRIDYLARLFLSLKYSTSSEKIRYFVRMEVEWFYLRYYNDTIDKLDYLDITTVSENEKMEIQDKCSDLGISPNRFNNIVFYKIYFAKIPQLVECRQLYIWKGYAYFPDYHLFRLICNRLSIRWVKKVANIQRSIPNVLKMNRVQHILDRLEIVMEASEFGSTRNGEALEPISLGNIDLHARYYFPLCTKSIHDLLRKEHHLKYDCKMQLGIFLKTIGMPYEDMLNYWREEFTQKMNEDLYNRKYEYLFKHQYGQVGGRIQYDPFTCDDVINSHVGPLQQHGCPFKTWNDDKLRNELCTSDSVKLKMVEIEEIMSLVGKQMYRAACSKYCNSSCRRNEYVDTVVHSPHEYYEKCNSNDQATESVVKNFVNSL